MKTLIKNGRVIDPANHVDEICHLILEDGKVAALTRELPQGDYQVIDATGKVVCPGFLDIHMHEAPVHDLEDLNRSVFGCMLRMGVTTVLGGNCGETILPPGEYFELVSGGLPVNLALLAGHEGARHAAGFTDRYASLDEAGVQKVKAILKDWLQEGCFGISYGIRYVPGINRHELLETAELCKKDHLLVSAHVRDDADYIFDSITEFLEVGQVHGVPCQVSHLGSMGGYGQMAQVLTMLEKARDEGLDVLADCYPYSAFSTRIGETTYDPGFLERYHCGYDAIVLSGGEYDGQHCTEELFFKLRREHPETITVAHVMTPEDITLALEHPMVMLCSDGVRDQGAGHPRAAGSFPRLLARYTGPGKLSLNTAIEKMTAMPARRLSLNQKGNLAPGSDADVVIFDPDTIEDTATFEDPSLTPRGIDYVLIRGEVACKDGQILNNTLGAPLRRPC